METPSFIGSPPPPLSSDEERARNKKLIDRFLQSINSDATKYNSLNYIHIYMRYWHLYQEKTASELLLELEEEKDRRRTGSSFDGLLIS
jgi:hypothetical protein